MKRLICSTSLENAERAVLRFASSMSQVAQILNGIALEARLDRPKLNKKLTKKQHRARLR